MSNGLFIEQLDVGRVCDVRIGKDIVRMEILEQKNYT
jgi:hypothetical protein